MRQIFLACCAAILLAACATAPKLDTATLAAQVSATERAFAQTMANRDHAAFASFIDNEAIFYGSKNVLRGREEIAASWKHFYTEPAAPFSWEPTQVEVLPSGQLAHSSGPVRDPSGKVVASYNSIWRLQAPGVWKIIFDKGCDGCDCAKP